MNAKIFLSGLMILMSGLFAQEPMTPEIKALFMAVEKNDKNAVKLALKAKPELNIPSETTGDTPLITAINPGYFEICELIINAGADVNAPTKYGNTPLLQNIIPARRFARPDQSEEEDDDGLSDKLANAILMAKMLIKAGADVNKANFQSGETPLHLAASSGHVEMVETLLAAKADVSIKNNMGRTALEDLENLILEMPDYDDWSSKQIIKLLKQNEK